MTKPDDDERLTVIFETPTPYHTLAEWLDYRGWLIAEFGDRPIGKSYIRSADKQIAAIRAYGDPFANVR